MKNNQTLTGLTTEATAAFNAYKSALRQKVRKIEAGSDLAKCEDLSEWEERLKEIWLAAVARCEAEAERLWSGLTKTFYREQAMLDSEFNPNWATAPGAALEELFDSGIMDKEIAAKALGMEWREFLDLLAGGLPVTPELARDLDRLTGLDAGFWLRREARWRAYLETHNG